MGGCDTTGVDPEPRPCSVCTGDTFVGLDGRDSFLRLQGDDGALGPAYPSLIRLGLAPGDNVCFEARGDYSVAPGVTARQLGQPLVIAAFSASETFLDETNQVRIADAVGPDGGLVTPATYIDGLPTDFPQDFDATDTCVTVPAGARYLFMGAYDNFYSDNDAAGSEPFGVRIVRQ